jgi:hypothetical protein
MDTPQINGQLACDGHNGFFACRPRGQGAFSQRLPPFNDWFVIGLETHQSPGQLHQRRSQTRIPVFGHTTLQSRLAATVFSGT